MVAKCSTCKWKVAPSSGQNRNQFKWSHELFLEIRKWWFDRNTNLIFGNTASLKWRNIWTSQSRFKGQREQTLSTYVLVDFFFKRLDLFMHSVHTHDSKFRYMINITLPKLLNSSPGWDSERGSLCSHQGGHSLKLLQLRHHGSGRQLHQPLQDSWLPVLRWQGWCKEDWQQCGEGEGLPRRRPCGHQQPAALPQRPLDPNCVAVSDDQLGKVHHWENNPAQ